jgi:hypothetical protein
MHARTPLVSYPRPEIRYGANNAVLKMRTLHPTRLDAFAFAVGAARMRLMPGLSRANGVATGTLTLARSECGLMNRGNGVATASLTLARRERGLMSIGNGVAGASTLSLTKQ